MSKPATRTAVLYDRTTGKPVGEVEIRLDVVIGAALFDALKEALIGAGHGDVICDFARVIAASEFRLVRSEAQLAEAKARIAELELPRAHRAGL